MDAYTIGCNWARAGGGLVKAATAAARGNTMGRVKAWHPREHWADKCDGTCGDAACADFWAGFGSV